MMRRIHLVMGGMAAMLAVTACGASKKEVEAQVQAARDEE